VNREDPVGGYHRDPVPAQYLRQFGQPGGAHSHARLGGPRDEVGGLRIGDEFAPTDNDQVLGRHCHLGQQMRGDQDCPPGCCQALHELPDPQDALGVEPVHRLVEEQNSRVAQDRSGQTEPLFHAQRVLADRLGRDTAQPDRVQHIVDPFDR